MKVTPFRNSGRRLRIGWVRWTVDRRRIPQECKEGRDAPKRSTVGMVSADLRLGAGKTTYFETARPIPASFRGRHMGYLDLRVEREILSQLAVRIPS